ncbi:hypothetical protein LSAT2_027355 [Lamellibrachia satsuma]|nr:hypothetical protein LSAT2_027355 [Lamellibrachia satsuma]
MAYGEKPGRCRISVRPTTIVTDFVPSTLGLPTEAVVQAVQHRTEALHWQSRKILANTPSNPSRPLASSKFVLLALRKQLHCSIFLVGSIVLKRTVE